MAEHYIYIAINMYKFEVKFWNVVKIKCKLVHVSLNYLGLDQMIMNYFYWPGISTINFPHLLEITQLQDPFMADKETVSEKGGGRMER